jgi:hypothetical protein
MVKMIYGILNQKTGQGKRNAKTHTSAIFARDLASWLGGGMLPEGFRSEVERVE